MELEFNFMNQFPRRFPQPLCTTAPAAQEIKNTAPQIA